MTKISSPSPSVVNDVGAPRSSGAPSSPGFFSRLLARFQAKRQPASDTAPLVRRYEVTRPPALVTPRMGATRAATPAVTTAAAPRPAPSPQDGGAPREDGPGWAEARATIARWVADADAPETPLNRSGAAAAEAFQDLSDTLSRIAARPTWKRWLLPSSRDAPRVVAHELAPLTRAVRCDLQNALAAFPGAASALERKATTEILRALAAKAVMSRGLGPADRERWDQVLTGALRVHASRAGAVTEDEATALRITLQAMRDAL